MAVQQDIDYEIHYGDPEVTQGHSVFSQEFDNLFSYDGDDLGVRYSSAASVFKLWAPTAWEAYLILYRNWDEEPDREEPMVRGDRGTWSLTVDGDLEGWFYTYKVRVGDQWNEAADPYAKAVGVNGEKSGIVDLATTNPDGWTAVKPESISPVDAVIYELHVRDFSIHPESGIQHRGKYLGLCESGTRGPGGVPTGLDHLARLGVTHVQLLPISDYSSRSVDETRLDEPQYNWGYDPQNYNVPEGSYATDPYDPAVRIRELKQAIQCLHDQGIRVIMDVVYNHAYDGYRIHFTKLVPGYYMRYKADGTFSNGSGCGNDTASERKMMRKYMIDSILYWAREYQVDGFRFDLMGLHDIGTLQEIRRRLDEYDPAILLIGEGWNIETALPESLRATLAHAAQLPGIAQFNDSIRNAVKGDIFHRDAKGFVNGGGFLENQVMQGAAGSIAYSEAVTSFALKPDQTVNYVECHDNLTLWDKIELTNPEESSEIRRRMHRLATGIILTSQGIPFLHAGQEFMRTKYGVEDSYSSPDAINQLDWARCAEHGDDVEYMRQLILLRKTHPAFRLKTAEEIRSHLYFENAPDQCVAFTLRNHAGGDLDPHLYVLYHALPGCTEIGLPELGPWEVIFGSENIRELEENQVQVEGIGMIVLAVKE